MTDIDWSKAPEGSTHAEMGPFGHPIWYSIQVGKSYWWRQRSPSDTSGDWASGPDLDGMDEWETRPAAPWPGEGLPPVGTVCITTDNDKELEVKILAYADGADGRDYVMVCEMLGDLEDQLHAWVAQMCTFSPIKTPEQIAAEEREAIVKQMMKDVCCAAARDIFEDLYDAGYRKVEGGAE